MVIRALKVLLTLTLLTSVGWLIGFVVGWTTTDWHADDGPFTVCVRAGTLTGLLLGLAISSRIWTRNSGSRPVD